MAKDLKKILKILKQPLNLEDLGGVVVVQGTGTTFGLAGMWQEQLPDTTVVQMGSVMKWKLLLVCIG